MNQETHQNKNSTALDDDKTSDDESYEEDDIFTDDDYGRIAFIQDVTCNMNSKAGIPDCWILLYSQSMTFHKISWRSMAMSHWQLMWCSSTRYHLSWPHHAKYTLVLVKDMKNNTLVTSIELVIQAYQSRGFKIQAILGDGQFKHIQQLIEEKGHIDEHMCSKWTCTRNCKSHQNSEGKSKKYCRDITIWKVSAMTNIRNGMCILAK